MATYLLLPVRPTGFHLNSSLQSSRDPQILVNPCRHWKVSSSARWRPIVLHATLPENAGSAAGSSQVPPTAATPLTPSTAPRLTVTPLPPMTHQQHQPTPSMPSTPQQAPPGSITITPVPATPPTPAATQGVTIDLFNLPPWIGWVFGSFFFSAIPVYRRMKMAQEKMEKTVGVMATAVEKVAEETDKVAEELAESLPEGKIKDIARKVEKVAEMVDKEAEAAAELIEKVDELTDRLEEIVEPILECEDGLRVNNDSGSKNVKSKL